jgi:hypothetical protein
MMLKNYFQDIYNTTKTGDATEESYCKEGFLPRLYPIKFEVNSLGK